MISIHNLMEDLIFKEVNIIYDELIASKPSWFSCGCHQCRLDTICYVLNRIKPYYVKSSKGLANFVHPNESIHQQLIADINSFAVEGAKQVATNMRPHDNMEDGSSINCPVFNFPAITGHILDGKTFLPMSDIKVYLKIANTVVEQISGYWQNPYVISEQIPGTFTFLPKYVKATEIGLKEIFPFSIYVEKEGYEPLNYYFKIGVQSTDSIRDEISMQNYFRLPDLYMFS